MEKTPRQILEEKRKELATQLINLQEQEAEAVRGLVGIRSQISQLQQYIQRYIGAISAINDIERTIGE